MAHLNQYNLAEEVEDLRLRLGNSQDSSRVSLESPGTKELFRKATETDRHRWQSYTILASCLPAKSTRTREASMHAPGMAITTCTCSGDPIRNH